MKLVKSTLKISFYATCFFTMLFLGVAGYNLFYLSEKYRMMQTVNKYHAALINNDKAVIDDLLTDDFTETGARHFVQTPEVIDKRQVMMVDYSKIFAWYEAKFLEVNIFGNTRDSLSFFRQLFISTEERRSLPADVYFVTYTFREAQNGLKISKIERIY